MKDERLADPEWKKRVGFDNIDPRPIVVLESKRKKSGARISDAIDRELFRK